MEKTQKLSGSLLRQHQSTRLRALLLHAFKEVPYYRTLMEDAGLTPLDIQTVDDLALLPALTKRDLQEHQAEFIACLPSKKAVVSPSRDQARERHHEAIKAGLVERCRRSAGLYPGMRYAALGEREFAPDTRPWPGSLGRLVERWTDRAVRFHPLADPGGYGSFVQLLRKYKPLEISGAAELIVDFAQYCAQHEVKDVRFEAALIEGAILSGRRAEVVTSTLGSNLFSRYERDRLPVIAWECSAHAGLHVNEDALIVELDPLPGLPSGHGRVLVTDLNNYNMPLIRYEVGDIARWCEPEPCACGCSLQRLSGVEETLAEFRSQRFVDLSLDLRANGTLGRRRDDLWWTHDSDTGWMN